MCGDCHGELGWGRDVFFEHDLTRFPLLGLHAVIACEQCHANPRFKDAEIVCSWLSHRRRRPPGESRKYLRTLPQPERMESVAFRSWQGNGFRIERCARGDRLPRLPWVRCRPGCDDGRMLGMSRPGRPPFRRISVWTASVATVIHRGPTWRRSGELQGRGCDDEESEGFGLAIAMASTVLLMGAPPLRAAPPSDFDHLRTAISAHGIPRACSVRGLPSAGCLEGDAAPLRGMPRRRRWPSSRRGCPPTTSRRPRTAATATSPRPGRSHGSITAAFRRTVSSATMVLRRKGKSCVSSCPAPTIVDPAIARCRGRPPCSITRSARAIARSRAATMANRSILEGKPDGDCVDTFPEPGDHIPSIRARPATT